MTKYILDACALIAFLRKEKGGDNVKKLLLEADSKLTTIYIHNASLAEVYYDFIKAADKATADETLIMITKLPLVFLNTIDMDFIKGIAFFKSNFKVSFADCFCTYIGKIV